MTYYTKVKLQTVNTRLPSHATTGQTTTYRGQTPNWYRLTNEY